MKIVIVGAGAIGRLFGALLSRGGHEIVFVESREEIVAAINKHGVGLMAFGTDDPDDISFTGARAVTSAAAIRNCDTVIMAVKSYDTLAAIKNVAPLISAAAPVLSLQTGLGNLETMAKVVPQQALMCGFTYMAGTALGADRVRHGGRGGTSIGELDGIITPRLERLCRAFNESGIRTDIAPDIVDQLWCKVIVFSAINPVSAILRVSNGRLLRKVEAVTLMKRLVDEARAVAAACTVNLVCDDLYDLLFEICRNTANNISSMLQDLVNERRTEIEALNGALCRYGDEHGVPVTTHRTILELIRLLEERRHRPGQPVDAGLAAFAG